MLKYTLIAGALLVVGILYAYAQQGGALVVTTCGTLPQAFAVGSTRTLTVDTNGNLCS